MRLGDIDWIEARRTGSGTRARMQSWRGKSDFSSVLLIQRHKTDNKFRENLSGSCPLCSVFTPFPGDLTEPRQGGLDQGRADWTEAGQTGSRQGGLDRGRRTGSRQADWIEAGGLDRGRADWIEAGRSGSSQTAAGDTGPGHVRGWCTGT